MDEWIWECNWLRILTSIANPVFHLHHLNLLQSSNRIVWHDQAPTLYIIPPLKFGTNHLPLSTILYPHLLNIHSPNPNLVWLARFDTVVLWHRDMSTSLDLHDISAWFTGLQCQVSLWCSYRPWRVDRAVLLPLLFCSTSRSSWLCLGANILRIAGCRVWLKMNTERPMRSRRPPSRSKSSHRRML